MSGKATHTYDYTCFANLIYEFSETQIPVVEKKIKARLKYHKLGAYDQKRVDLLRAVKNELSNEISLYNKSKYYHKSDSEFTDMKDFDTDQMSIDMSVKFPEIEKDEMRSMVGFAVHYYHTR